VDAASLDKTTSLVVVGWLANTNSIDVASKSISDIRDVTFEIADIF